eukprot:g10760.t2
MTKENLVSDGVLPASSLEDKGGPVAGTLRGRAEGRGKGKGGARGKGREEEDEGSPKKEVQASPVQTAGSGASGALGLPPMELPSRQVSGEEGKAAPRNPMNNFLARVLKPSNEPNQAEVTPAPRLGLPPPTGPPAALGGQPESQEAPPSPTHRPPVPGQPPPPPPGTPAPAPAQAPAQAPPCKGWLEPKDSPLVPPTLAPAAPAPAMPAPAAPAPAAGPGAGVAAQDLPMRPGPLMGSPPRQPPTLSPTMAPEALPEPLVSPQRSAVNLASALASAVTAPQTAPMASAFEMDLGLNLGDGLLAPAVTAPPPQALQPGRVTIPPRQAEPTHHARLQEEQWDGHGKRPWWAFEKDRCWYYKDPSAKVQGPFTTSQMQNWHQVGYFRPDLPIRFRDGQFYRLDQLYPDAPFRSLPMAADPRAQAAQETQLQVPDNYTAGRLVQVLHRQIPMKPGAKMALLWKHRKIFMDERLSDLGMEDCEDWISGVEGTGPEWDWKELTYIFEATAVRQACEAFAGLVHGENRIYALEGLTKLHIGRNLQGGLQNIHLPDSLQALTFGAFFDQSLQGVTLPSRLRILAFSSVFSRRLDPAPSLRSISLDEDFNHPLQQVTLPEGLQTLSFGRSFNQSLRGLKLPASLLNLVLSANFNQSLQGVDSGDGWGFGRWTGRVGAKVQRNLVLGYHFNQSLEEVKLPRGLASLQFGKSFNQSLERVSFPKNLQSLTLGQDRSVDEDGHERMLDPDSESEVEGDEAACQGVRIGIVVEGEMRPLAPDGCNDMATQEETTLLDEDIEVSDVRPPGPGQLTRVPLCAHHRQVYQSAAAKRKCGVLTCHKASKGAKHGVPLCYDHLCEQGGSSMRKDSPHPSGMLQGFRRRFTRRSSSRSRSPALDDAASRPVAGPSEDLKIQAKKESGMVPIRSNSVDLGKVMIPSPPRGLLDQDDVMGRPVWLKVRVTYDNGEHEWIMCLGELAGYTPGGVRGDQKLEIYVKYLENTIIVDPKYLEDMVEVHNVEEVDPAKAQHLVKELPQDAAGIGLDIKGYLVPEPLIQRLRSWEGRTLVTGRRLNSMQLAEVKQKLSTMVRKHSAGYIKGELWPSWPAEAELGIDRQVRGRDEGIPKQRGDEPRRRSRSRSHSLARVMKEEDEAKQKAECGMPMEVDTEEMTGDGIIESYLTAVGTGQTHKEAIDTIQMIFEVDMQAINCALRGYIRKNCGRQNEQVETAIKILKGVVEQGHPAEKSVQQLGETPSTRTKTPERKPVNMHEKLFPSSYEGIRDDGNLIRPAEVSSKVNPLVANDGIVGQLFGLGGKVEDTSTRAGAGGDEEDGQMGARVVHALEGLRKATEGDKKGNPGTRGAIGAEESLDVYLARGCNTLTVEVCPDVTGKELFDALKRACSHAKAKLQQIEWPCLVTNGIAYGLAAMQHGGKDHTTLAPWQLSVAHAVTAKPRDFDQYEAPKDDKIEPKPRYPTHFATWLKQAENEIKMLGSVLGLEHKKERLKALDQIERAHEQDSDVWPENYCYSLWEELKAAWTEELRESRRQLCRILNTDNPRKEDLKFVALAPDSGFHFPRTFDLAHPDGYYQQVCVPRQARALKGIIYGQLHHKRQAPKVGGDAPGAEGEAHGREAGGEEDRVGRGRDRGGDKDKKKREKEKDEKRAYPAGKRLRPREAADSVKHGPRTKEGKPICWDGATHMGCSRGKECNHAHQPITTTKGAQLIRRGGLKSGPLIQPAQVDGRIAQLRAQAKAEHDEKVKDGGAQKQGWLPPEEYEGVQYTQLEDELRELTRGPDVGWLKDPMLEQGREPCTIWERRVEHPEAQKRLKILEELEKGGAFARLANQSSYLQSHVRGRMLNAIIDKQEMTLDEVLLEATEKGCPELAQEAEKLLSEGRSVGWSDDERQAWISAPTWHKDKGYGEGKFEFQCGDKRICWRYLDYKDKLTVPDELASALGLQPGEEEERQCLVLHPAAGVLLWEGDWDPERRPTIEDVKKKAQAFRAGLWDEAASAIAELGDPAPWIGAREADVRSYAHDCLRAHHDKDYRLFQAFVLDELREVTLQCWRLNCRGQLQIDHLVGSSPGSEGQIIPFLIHGGHIRLLVPNEKEEPVKIAAELTLSGQVDREWQCEGWREFLANEDTAAPLVPGKRPKCPRCQEHQPKQGKAAPQVPWSFNEHPVDTQELILMGARAPLKHRPSFAYGIRVQEVFASSGTWTSAMLEAGLGANEPVELFGDPLQKRDPREHLNLKNEDVANHYLQATMEMPGPGAANIWEFGTPCTSYCDFNILNGGTRSFQSPEGGPNPTASEKEGNYFCELTCKMCEQLFAHDKEFILESSMPSGRYPKIWDQPAVQKLQLSTGALIVPTHLCEWGASPSDRPDMRYKKGQWNLVSPGLYLHSLLLARRCQGHHRHMDVKGESDIPGVPRTRRAQVYPVRLCRGWALVVQAAYAGWDTIQVAQALEVIQEGDGREGEIPHKQGKNTSATSATSSAQGPPHSFSSSSSASLSSPSSGRCGSAEDSEFTRGFMLVRGYHCGSIGEGEFQHGITIPEEPDEAVQEEGEEEEALSDDDRRMNPRDEAAIMARLVPREVEPGENVEPIRPYEGRIDVFGPPRPLEGMNGRSEDWWDFQENSLFLIRHHVMPRRTMFGTHYGDWLDCPVADYLIRSDRRTWMFPQRREVSEAIPRERVFLDNWRVDLARLRDIPDSIEAEYADWTGATTFYLYDPNIRPELGPHFGHGQEEGADSGDDQGQPEVAEQQPTLPEGRDYRPVFRPPREIEPPRGYYPGGGVWDPWRGGRIEETEHEEVHPQAGSSGDRRQRSRSRSRGQAEVPEDGGNERRVGYLAASHFLEYEEEQVNNWLDGDQFECRPAVGYLEENTGCDFDPKVFEKAMAYMEHCRAHPKYEAPVIKKAVALGDDLLRTAGSLEKAMEGLRAARHEVIGAPTRGATTPEVLSCLEPEHAEYLKAMNEGGVRTRRYYPARRLKAEPYPSAVEHLEEMYQKAWKDGHWGIVLFASDATEQCTSNLIECIRCLIAKLDVSRAFKWHDVAPSDTADFGSALPGKPVGIEGRVKMIYGGLPFGWCGAPGEYMAFALAGRAYHESFKPAEETVNGPSPFSSEWLMDDSVVVEPLIGVRPWQAVDALGHAIEKIWGKDALNLEKQVEEGTPATEQIVWGLFMNVESMTIRLPEPKALKMRYLLALPELQPGGRAVRLRVAQELRGLGQYAAITIPPLRTELNTIDMFLSPSKCEGGYIRPNVPNQEEVETAWRCWDEMLALFRLWFETPYEGSFEASMESMLTTRELLALPGMKDRLRWIGGDATPEVAGALDWKSKHYMRESAKEMLQALSRVPELSNEPDMKIALAELLCFVGLAAAESHMWHGELIAYATDNQNVRSWLTRRQSKCAVARHILRVLGMLEVRYHFKTVAFYIRTYHNITADWLSRETKSIVEKKLELDGWVKVDAQEDWERYIEESVKGIFKWPGGETIGSLEVPEGASVRPYRPTVAKGFAVELGRGRLPWAIAWARLGGQVCTAPGQRSEGEAKLEAMTLGEPNHLNGDIDLTWAFASIAEDSWGGSRTFVKNFVKEYRPENVLVDMAREGPIEEVKISLEKLGYGVELNECLTTYYGDPVAKRKTILLASLQLRGGKCAGPGLAPRSASEPTSIQRTLDHAANVARPEWFGGKAELTLNTKISTTGDRMLPWPAGHCMSIGGDEKERKELVYDIRGPALTCRRGRTMMVVDHRGTTAQVRRITAEEEWLLNGGGIDELRTLHELGTTTNYYKKDAAMKFPQQSAHRILSWFERWRQDSHEADRAEDQKVGVCYDEDRFNTDEQVKAWMRAWQGDHQNPRASYEKWLASQKAGGLDDEKIGGRRQPSARRAKSAPPDKLVLPSAIGRGRERLKLDANRELRRDQAWLDALAAEAVMSKLSEGTRAGYEVGWRQWCLWRRLSNKGVYLTGENKEDRKTDEDELLRFMTYLAHVMGRSEGTVKQRLFAIKMGHLVAGHDDPTMNRVRIWAALNGFKRWQPETKRKYPVLPGMLSWIKRHLNTSDSLSRCDQVIIWAAIMVGFFFLLRASEFLITIGRTWGRTRTLKGSDVEARKDNQQVTNFHVAEEVVIYLKGSKTDQYNQGTVRNQFKSGSELCVVSALADYQSMKPERFAGAEENQPLFRLEDGNPLQRGDIQNLIQLAAVADGQSTTRYGSHSLRIGGATAMYQTTKDLDVVKRYGRWNSDAFHGYLWESHERQKDLAKGMACADGQLLAPRKNKGYEASSQIQERQKAEAESKPVKQSGKVGALPHRDEVGALEDLRDEGQVDDGYTISNKPPLGFLARLRQLWQAPPIRCESLSFSHLQVLNLGPDFEQPLGHWELQHLRELHTGRSSELPKLHPESLQVLSFRGEQKDTLDLQSFQHLRSLTWGSSPLECGVVLPKSLEVLNFSEDFNQPLRVKWPRGLRSLSLGDRFNRPIDELPKTLETLCFGADFDQSLNQVLLPRSLKSLSFGDRFNHALEEAQLPSGLQHLSLGCDFNRSLVKVRFPPLQSLTLGTLPHDRPLHVAAQQAAQAQAQAQAQAAQAQLQAMARQRALLSDPTLAATAGGYNDYMRMQQAAQAQAALGANAQFATMKERRAVGSASPSLQSLMGLPPHGYDDRRGWPDELKAQLGLGGAASGAALALERERQRQTAAIKEQQRVEQQRLQDQQRLVEEQRMRQQMERAQQAAAAAAQQAAREAQQAAREAQHAQHAQQAQQAQQAKPPPPILPPTPAPSIPAIEAATVAAAEERRKALPRKSSGHKNEPAGPTQVAPGPVPKEPPPEAPLINSPTDFPILGGSNSFWERPMRPVKVPPHQQDTKADKKKSKEEESEARRAQLKDRFRLGPARTEQIFDYLQTLNVSEPEPARRFSEAWAAKTLEWKEAKAEKTKESSKRKNRMKGKEVDPSMLGFTAVPRGHYES